jgi:hypothetical protein
VEPFRIHVADEVLDDLRARLRRTRWPDQVPGIGWKQGTELDWLRHLVSYWTREFDWRAWEQRLNTLDHFTWEGIHFVYRRAASGRGVPLILTHGWPGSFLDYLDMLRCSVTSTWSHPPCPDMDSHPAHPRLESTTDTSRSAGIGLCPSLGILAMVRAAMTLGPE